MNKKCNLWLILFIAIIVLWGCGGGGGGGAAISKPSPTISAGTLDSSFSEDGIVTTTPVGYSFDYAYAIGIQSDGKIVVAGSSGDGKGGYGFSLLRYNSAGSVDTGFGTGGIVITAVGNSGSFAYALGIQSDGKIVVAGYAWNVDNYDFALVRYNTDGSLDPSFGTGGIVITPIRNKTDIIYALGIQSDGRIVVAGFSEDGNGYADFALARYNANGSLDPGFGTNGIVITPVGSDHDGAKSLVIQADGKIVVAGNIYNGSDFDFAVMRYKADGSLDAGFGTGGVVTTHVGYNHSLASSLGIQSDGKIIVAGSQFQKTDSQYSDFALVRYNTDGSLDSGFGAGGIVNTTVGSYGAVVYALDIQSDDKIVAAGAAGRNDSITAFALARYQANGSPDTSFGTDGVVITPIGDDTAYALALGLQSDGKIVAAGTCSGNGNSDFAILRYLP